MDNKIKDLELFRKKYESLEREIQETFDSNKIYMDKTTSKLRNHMIVADDK